MCYARLTVPVFLAATLCACASKPIGINGTWYGTLANSGGSEMLAFTGAFEQGSGSSLNVSGFSITFPSTCFSSSTTETATFSASGSSNGYQTGALQMTISTMFPESVNNVVILNGNRDGTGNFSGTWSMTGVSGCSGNGTFAISTPEGEGYTGPVDEGWAPMSVPIPKKAEAEYARLQKREEALPRPLLSCRWFT